jgi:hypothetical protein
VSETPGDLDNHGLGGVQDVDACDVAAGAADPLLGDGSRQAGFADQRQEASLEHRLATTVDEQLIEQPHTVATAATQFAEPLDQHERGGQAQSDRAVDGGTKTIRCRPCRGEIENRSGRRCAAETTDREHVDGAEIGLFSLIRGSSRRDRGRVGFGSRRCLAVAMGATF